MKIKICVAFALIGIAASTALPAQTPTAQPSDPAAASSAHQRAVTKSPAEEVAEPGHGSSASESATPHQNQVMKKKHRKTSKASAPPSNPR